MGFKESGFEFQVIDVTRIEQDPAHPRRQIDEASLKGLENSIRQLGLIQPLVVMPADASGKHRVIVGGRRLQAAISAGETSVPALIRKCSADDTFEVQVFENMGLGIRAPLEPRDMANAIQAVAERFENREKAAEHFGRPETWLTQATAAANLSPKIEALLDSGKIGSTSTAIQLERLAQKSEEKVEELIGQIEQLPEGEKISKKVIDNALTEVTGRKKKKVEEVVEPVASEVVTPAVEQAPSVSDSTPSVASEVPPWEEATAVSSPAPSTTTRRVNPRKVEMVAKILGLPVENEEEVLARLIDEFLALKGEGI